MGWLKAIRKQKGFTQEKLSQQVKITQPSYCNIETGKRRPSPEVAQKIASILNFKWTRFFEEDNKTAS